MWIRQAGGTIRRFKFALKASGIHERRQYDSVTPAHPVLDV
jgi:hypothetical protein